MKNPKNSGKGSSQKGPSSSSADRKSRWESSDRPSPKPSKPPNPNPNPNPNPPPELHPPQPELHPSAAAPPPYGFQNLDRRTIALADGSVRSYFALPPDYPMDHFPPRGGPHLDPAAFDHRQFPPRFSPDEFPPPFAPRGPPNDYWSSLNLDGPRGPHDGPRGPHDGPRGPHDGPRAPHDGPRGPLDGSRGLLDAPRGLLDGPRCPPDGPGGPSSSLKRKYGEEDEFAWHRQHVLQYGNPNGIPLGPGGYMGGSPSRREHLDEMRLSKQVRTGGEEGVDEMPGSDVDRQAVKKAFLNMSKLLNENVAQRKSYLDDGKSGALKCIVCDRTSKEFADVHGLIMHAFNTKNPELRADHLGLHKALCILMGWNYAKAPENSKAYQSLSTDDVTANREDLILWPPTVIIHNTNTGKKKDGRMDGMGNKDMDIKIKELGFGGGKSKSIYGKEGHTGVTQVKFASTQAGLKEAERLAEFLEKENHGRRGWDRAQASQSLGGDDDKNPLLVKVDEKSGEKKRILYGYLAIASDLDKLDFEMKKKAVVKSRREFDLSD